MKSFAQLLSSRLTTLTALASLSLGAPACSSSDPPRPATSTGATNPIEPDAPSSALKTCPTGASFDHETGKVVLRVMLDGKGPFKMFYDTGAPHSGVSPAVSGKPANAAVTFGSVDLGSGVMVGPLETVTTDLPPDFDGVIGNDLFAKKVVTIDYKRAQLWVDDELDEGSLAACQHAAGTPAVMGIDVGARGHLYVPAKVQGVEGHLLVDTGASVGGISMDVFERSNNHPIVMGYAIRMMFGTFWGGYTIVDDMSVGGRSVTRLSMLAQPNDMIPAAPRGRTLGVLPYGYLQHFLVTIDLRMNKLRLDPFVNEAMANGAELLGYGFSLSVNEEGPVTISRLVDGSPAAQAGLQLGDEVVAIGSTNPSTVAPEKRIRLVLTTGPGRKTTLTIARGSEQLTVNVDAADLFASR